MATKKKATKKKRAVNPADPQKNIKKLVTRETRGARGAALANSGGASGKGATKRVGKTFAAAALAGGGAQGSGRSHAANVGIAGSTSSGRQRKYAKDTAAGPIKSTKKKYSPKKRASRKSK